MAPGEWQVFDLVNAGGDRILELEINTVRHRPSHPPHPHAGAAPSLTFYPHPHPLQRHRPSPFPTNPTPPRRRSRLRTCPTRPPPRPPPPRAPARRCCWPSTESTWTRCAREPSSTPSCSDRRRARHSRSSALSHYTHTWGFAFTGVCTKRNKKKLFCVRPPQVHHAGDLLPADRLLEWSDDQGDGERSEPSHPRRLRTERLDGSAALGPHLDPEAVVSKGPLGLYARIQVPTPATTLPITLPMHTPTLPTHHPIHSSPSPHPSHSHHTHHPNFSSYTHTHTQINNK